MSVSPERSGLAMNSISTEMPNSHCGCEWRGQEGGSKPPEALLSEKQERGEGKWGSRSSQEKEVQILRALTGL